MLNENNMNEKDFKSIFERIEKLEKAVFNSVNKKGAVMLDEGDYTGATGGIRLLKSKGFFKTKHTLGEVRGELINYGYHYSTQAVQMGINRLSKSSGPLVTFKEGGRKVYAERK
jgi:hypothetical protein